MALQFEEPGVVQGRELELVPLQLLPGSFVAAESKSYTSRLSACTFPHFAKLPSVSAQSAGVRISLVRQATCYH